MVKWLLFLLSLLLYLNVSAQTKGVVKNSNNENIPYVNIAFLHANKGVCSDDDGYFEVDIENHLSDTIKFSSIGYESLLIPVSKLLTKESWVLFMNEKAYTLSGLVIRPEKLTNKYSFGFINKSKKTSHLIPSVGTQIATYIQNTNQKKGYIQTIVAYFEKDRNYKTVDIRIRILECTDSLTPGNDLLQDNILINPKNGRNKIDISKYNISFPLNGVFVAIDIVDSKNVTKGKWMNVYPAIKFTFDYPYEYTWFNYRDREWNIHDYRSPSTGAMGNARVGLEILSAE